jgi:hypothetical protein
MLVGPNPAYGRKHGLKWGGDRWVVDDTPQNPNADLERQAAELALEQRRWEFEQQRRSEDKPAGDPANLRTLMQEARQAMADQRQKRAAAEQIAREMSDEEVSASGRPWRWDGNQMQYTDTPEESRRLARSAAVRDKQQGEANMRRERAMLQTLRNSQGMALEAEREKRRKTGQGGPLMRKELEGRIQRQQLAQRFRAGQAAPIPPQDAGTPYGGGRWEAMYQELISMGMDPDEALQQAQGMAGDVARG